MQKIKALLINHGEKVIFAIIAIICLWSILGNIFADPELLWLPTGEMHKIDRTRMERNIKKVKDQLNNKDKTQPEPKVKEVSYLVQDARAQHKRPVDMKEMEWLAYTHPPKPIKSIVPPAPPPPPEDPPEEYITAIGAPVEWAVKVGGRKIAIVCKDSPVIRYPLGESVHVALFRKVVGEARDEISPSVREYLFNASYDKFPELKKKTEAVEDAEGDFGGFAVPDLDEKPTSADAAMPVEDSGVPASMEEYIKRFLDRENAVRDIVREVIDLENLEAYELLTDDMPMFSERPDLGVILKQGLPEPLERQEEESLVSAKDEEDDEDEAGEVGQVGQEREAFVRRYYAFLDKDVKENVIYRYRMVAYCKPRPLPRSIVKQKPVLKSYDLRVEIGDMGASLFAMPRSQWEAFVKKEGEGKVDVRGTQPVFSSFFVDPKTRTERYKPRNDKNRLNPLWRGFIEDYSFSAFSYTDPVLTPIRTRIQLRSVSEGTDGTKVAMLRVLTRSDTGDEGYHSYPSFTAPKLPEPLMLPEPNAIKDPKNRKLVARVLRNLLKFGPDKKPLRDKDGNFVEKSLKEIYAPFKDLKCPEIGDVQVKRKEKWDFRTGWALVDIRISRVTSQKQKLEVVEVNGIPQKNPDGSEKKEWKDRGAPRIMFEEYLVVRELAPDKKPEDRRYKRIRRYKKPDKRDERRTKILTIDWEPALHDFLRMIDKRQEAEPKSDAKDAADPAEGNAPAGQ